MHLISEGFLILFGIQLEKRVQKRTPDISKISERRPGRRLSFDVALPRDAAPPRDAGTEPPVGTMSVGRPAEKWVASKGAECPRLHAERSHNMFIDFPLQMN